MLDDLTAGEIVAMIRAINYVPDGAMVFVGDTLTMFENHPDVVSLCRKIEQAATERDDVQELLAEISGGES